MSWKETFDKYPEAEGVDFVSLLAKPWRPGTIYESKTKEQMIAGCAYPRSNWLLWKMVNGKKEYIYQEQHKIAPGSIPCHPDRKVMFMIVDEDEINWGAFDNRQDAEEIAMSLYEEVAYEMACDLYTWHHHWDMERAVRTAWERVGWEYQIKEFDLWSFSPF